MAEIKRRRKRKVSNKKLTCALCNTNKSVQDFSNDRSRATGKFPWCKSCVSKHRTEARKVVHNGSSEKKCPVCEKHIGGTHKNRIYCSEQCKDKARRYRMYGLSPEEYKFLIKSMEGRCPICKNKVNRWEIDHNHKTGETYGPACRICNGFLIAYTGHSVERAERLVEFLKNPPVRKLLGEKRYVGPDQLSQMHRMWAWNGKPK